MAGHFASATSNGIMVLTAVPGSITCEKPVLCRKVGRLAPFIHVRTHNPSFTRVELWGKRGDKGHWAVGVPACFAS